MHKVIDVAHRFGVTSNIPAYLPVALGAAEITLEQQVQSYAIFPNDGIRVTPRLLRKVENADGITLWEQAPAVTEVTSQQTARTMMQLFKAVVQPGGTGGSAAQLKHPLGGKTGTTSDFTDAWFLGFSPSVTCGAWVGYDSRQSLGDKEQGARVALPIWIDFMREAIKGKDNEHFSGDTEPAAKTETAQSAPPAKTPEKPAAIAPTPKPKPITPAAAPTPTPAARPATPPTKPAPQPPTAPKPTVKPAFQTQPAPPTAPKQQPKPALPQ
jgi:penicillin-binding protein 1A